MRRDRDGELLDEQPDLLPTHRCEDGWLDPDAEVLTPCPVCRPGLALRVHTRRRQWERP